MEGISNIRLSILIYMTILLIFFAMSCQNNPITPVNNDKNIIIDYQNLNIELIEETDSTDLIHTTFEIIYYPENNGFQLFDHGISLHNSDKTYGRVFIYMVRRRGYPIVPHFIISEQKDTLTYSIYYDSRKDDPYTIFEYSLSGIYTDEPIFFDNDSLNINCCYFYSDTIVYSK